MLLGKLSKTISIFCFISTIIIGQDDFKRVGKSGFGFLKISPSARAAGMGDAFTAIADDVTPIFYNPAGLTNLNQFVFNFNHTDWIVNSSIISGETNYGIDFTSVISENYIFAMQCHPEKSSGAGLKLLKNFLAWNGNL